MAKADLESLRKASDKILHLPKQAQQVMDAYLHIRVDGTEAACPYHINSGLRSTSRALLGKGNPAEIEAAAARYFTHYAMRLHGDVEQLRSFLQACGIGVDCSGFVAWITNGITESRLGRPLWKCVRFPSVRRRVVGKIRPVENISANLLTGPANSRAVEDLSGVKPGDLIRAAGGHHVLVITEVGLDTASNARYFQYAQSSCMYGQGNGVRTGYAVIRKPRGSLLAQDWFDGGVKNIIRGLLAENEADNRVVRLKALT